MTASWSLFFPASTRVLALPSWRDARLYVPAKGIFRRWTGSKMYPAYRPLARFRRLELRVRAAAGLVPTRTTRSNGWPLGEFAQSVLPEVASAVVLIGYPGPTQKTTAQLLDGDGRTLGYLKYAEKDRARIRLRQERHMLAGIPSGLGPKLLKYGALSAGEALLITVVPGNLLPAKLPPEDGVVDFSTSLPTSSLRPVEEHPWVCSVCKEGGEELNRCFEVLAHKSWPVAVKHGDFVPWNIVRKPDGSMGAIDWEYGTLQGFPYMDLIYYILQCSFLVHRWTPTRATEYANKYLTLQPRFDLSSEEARALIRLAAYDVLQRYMDDGQPPPAPALGLPAPWWRTIWED